MISAKRFIEDAFLNDENFSRACFHSSQEKIDYEGKVREIIDLGNELKIIHTDRLSAFDRFIADVPLKGIILAAFNNLWHELLKNKVPLQKFQLTSPRVALCEKTKPVRIEVVVRGYLAGSLARSYEQAERSFCGVVIPEGLKRFQKLSHPIITPTTKEAAYVHDENISEEDLLKRNLCTSEQWQQIKDIAIKTFLLGQEWMAARNWLLVDTKYEFGIGIDGKVKLIDEIHTPDSSRFWKKSTYETRLQKGQEPEMFDKEVIRRELLKIGFSGHGDVPKLDKIHLKNLALTYLSLYEELTQKEFFLPL